MIIMKITFALLFFLFLHFSSYAQISSGVHFLEGLTWPEVVDKASHEGKSIFMDCYATWCGPCREMERDVFTDHGVLSCLEDKFICLRVQMDTTLKDNDNVRKWYPEAHRMMIAYKINAYPTYLFFSSNGDILHKDAGFKSPDEFIKVLDNASSASKQYYTLLKLYQEGKAQYSDMPLI